ncbi:hypothetical protein S83_054434 [Arachis hypogaea]
MRSSSRILGKLLKRHSHIAMSLSRFSTPPPYEVLEPFYDFSDVVVSVSCDPPSPSPWLPKSSPSSTIPLPWNPTSPPSATNSSSLSPPTASPTPSAPSPTKPTSPRVSSTGLTLNLTIPTSSIPTSLLSKPSPFLRRSISLFFRTF